MKIKSSSYSISDHYDGQKFFNPEKKVEKRALDILKLLLGNITTPKWPDYVENNKKPILANGTSTSFNQCYITYINHACHLIQINNLNILTDPIFSLRASPISWAGPKRVRPPGLCLNELPPIHLVLISHNHYDHMDLPSLIQLHQLFHPVFIVPLGNALYLKKKNINSIIELDWWETYSFNQKNENQTITLLPALHWSKRGLFDQNRALWGSFWIESGGFKIYFAGDTGYGQHFKTIQEKKGSPSVSLLPIGSYAPRWFMQPQHMNPEEAVFASLDLNSPLSIATHHQTFRLSYEGYEEPAQALKKSLQAHQIPESRFLAPENGETVIIQS